MLMQKVIHINTCGVGICLFRNAMMLLLLVLSITSCAPTAGIFAGGKWQSGGLQHQHIRSLAVDPNNPQIIYAGDAQDGVFVSTNAGMNWGQQSAGLTLPITIFALVFDDPGKKLYAATNRGLPSGIIFNSLAFDSVQHKLWAATNLGIYRSSDADMLWQVLNNGLPTKVVVNTILPAAISGGDKGLVFAGTNRGFFRSPDDGAQWSPSQVSLSGTSVNATLIDYHTVTTVYAGTAIGVLRSEDNGQNWGGIASGLPRDQPVQALAVGANGYNQLYAATNGIYLFPGNSSAFDPSQIFPILLVLAFFFALYQFTSRRRKRSQLILKPERIVETKLPLPIDFSQTNIADKTQTDGRLPEVQKHKRITEDDNADGKEDEI